MQSLPITARTLECLVRLSTAVARARLNDEIQPEDAREAVQMLKFALYAEEPEVDDEDLTFDNAEVDQEAAAEHLARKEKAEKARQRKAKRAAGAQPWEVSDDEDEDGAGGASEDDDFDVPDADEQPDEPRARKRRPAPESTSTYVARCRPVPFQSRDSTQCGHVRRTPAAKRVRKETTASQTPKATKPASQSTRVEAPKVFPRNCIYTVSSYHYVTNPASWCCPRRPGSACRGSS